MTDAGAIATLADREVDARILEHPFRIVVPDDERLRHEQRVVEAYRRRQVVHSHVDVKAFHRFFSCVTGPSASSFLTSKAELAGQIVENSRVSRTAAGAQSRSEST